MNPYADLLERETSDHQDLEQVRKKQKLSDEAPRADSEAEAVIRTDKDSTAAKDNGAASAGSRSVDLTGALTKLKNFLGHPKKVSKAISMILQLMEQKLDIDNVHLFVDVWAEFPFESLILSETDYFNDLRGVVKLMRNRVENSVCIQAEHRFQIETLYLATEMRGELNTDDTNQFSKSCKHIRSVVEALATPDEDIPEASLSKLLLFRKQMILLCMSDAFKLYKRQWAKQPVDLLFRTAAMHRHCFEGELLDRLDKLTEAITVEQRAATANTGPKTIRTFDSTSHPLRQKNVGILR